MYLCVLLCPNLQLLHICIEGWGNWRWSEAFSVDNVGTLLRTIQYKGRTASLIIKVVQLNGVQKQVKLVFTDSLLFLHLFWAIIASNGFDQKHYVSILLDFRPISDSVSQKCIQIWHICLLGLKDESLSFWWSKLSL